MELLVACSWALAMCPCDGDAVIFLLDLLLEDKVLCTLE